MGIKPAGKTIVNRLPFATIYTVSVAGERRLHVVWSIGVAERILASGGHGLFLIRHIASFCLRAEHFAQVPLYNIVRKAGASLLLIKDY